MGFCGSVPQTWLTTYNSLEFFKGASLKEKGGKKSFLRSLSVLEKNICILFYFAPLAGE